MPNKMLIDATHPEETRVVVVRGNRVEEFDFETAQRKQLRGNIYLAKVTRVEPSLQAAFIEYGGNRHGFLAFSEIHPDYYQIPVADRQALTEADERANREAEEESKNRAQRRRPRHRSSRRRGNGEGIQSEIVEHASPDTSLAAQSYEAQGREEGQEHAPEPEQNLHGEADHDHEHHHADAEDHERDHHEHAAHDHEHAHDEHDHLDHDHGNVQASETLAAVTLPDTAAVEASAAALDSTAEAHEAHAHNDHHEAYGHEDTIQTDQAPRAEDGGAAPSEHADGEAASDLGEQAAPSPGDQIQDDEDEADDAEEELVESVGGDDVLEEGPARSFRPRRQYKS